MAGRRDGSECVGPSEDDAEHLTQADERTGSEDEETQKTDQLTHSTGLPNSLVSSEGIEAGGEEEREVDRALAQPTQDAIGEAGQGPVIAPLALDPDPGLVDKRALRRDLGLNSLNLDSMAGCDVLPDERGYNHDHEADYDPLPGLELDLNLCQREEDDSRHYEDQPVVEEVVYELCRRPVEHGRVAGEGDGEQERCPGLYIPHGALERDVPSSEGVEDEVTRADDECDHPVAHCHEDGSRDHAHVAPRVQFRQVSDRHIVEPCRVDRRGDRAPHGQGSEGNVHQHNRDRPHGRIEVESIPGGRIRVRDHPQREHRDGGDHLESEGERIPPVRCGGVVAAQPIHPGLNLIHHSKDENGVDQVEPGQKLRGDDPGVVHSRSEAAACTLGERDGLRRHLPDLMKRLTAEIGGGVHHVHGSRARLGGLCRCRRRGWWRHGLSGLRSRLHRCPLLDEHLRGDRGLRWTKPVKNPSGSHFCQEFVHELPQPPASPTLIVSGHVAFSLGLSSLFVEGCFRQPEVLRF